MSAATVLEAVPELDSVQLQFLDTFKAGQGRNYSYMFNFEQEFEHSVVRIWMEDNWRPFCAWASGIYLLLIFGGQSVMASRPPFQLRGPLTVWNMFLAVFSIMGAARTLPEFIYTFSTQGFYHSLCVPSFIVRDRVSGFWTWMFVMSKVPELGDTIFIVLRKQRLIFLHWYHHVTVLIYCWYSFSEYTAPARWFVVMNFVVHSLMYTYYAFKALRFRIPKCVAMVITSLQLLQMIVGCVVNYTAYTFKRRGVKCGVSDTNLQLSLLMYTSYFVLFARFFYNTYFNKCEKGKEEVKKSHIKEVTKEEIATHLHTKEIKTDCTRGHVIHQKSVDKEEIIGEDELPMEENSKTSEKNDENCQQNKNIQEEKVSAKEISCNLGNTEEAEGERSKIQKKKEIHAEMNDED
eukprot:GFUD01003984.1.p1 GENE.GFUD01003984.1~~GFUD01003984.1.p1  ORF type:complete len:405 (-),score=105.45 GFUD01003984.1:141-1355(-)